MEQSTVDQVIDMIMADFGEMSVADGTLLPIHLIQPQRFYLK